MAIDGNTTLKPKMQGAGGAQSVVPEDRRRSQRVMIRTPVTLRFASKTIEAHTVEVNVHGAMLLCPLPVAAETKLELQNIRTQEKQQCRVVRRPVESAGGYLVPLEFAAAAANFWGISFPPANWKPSED